MVSRIIVSRYPRAVLPQELKEMFEINVNSKENSMNCGMYNDEFWKIGE